ncbi:hypothetical protein MTO96_032884 [Rhipicephalus appendiculatus]
MVSKGLHKKSAKGLTLALTDVGARRLPALPSQCWTAFHRSQDRCSSRSTETMLDWQPTGSVARRQGSSRRSPAAPASSGSVVPGSQRSLLSDPDEDDSAGRRAAPARRLRGCRRPWVRCPWRWPSPTNRIVVDFCENAGFTCHDLPSPTTELSPMPRDWIAMQLGRQRQAFAWLQQSSSSRCVLEGLLLMNVERNSQFPFVTYLVCDAARCDPPSANYANGEPSRCWSRGRTATPYGRLRRSGHHRQASSRRGAEEADLEQDGLHPLCLPGLPRRRP